MSSSFKRLQPIDPAALAGLGIAPALLAKAGDPPSWDGLVQAWRGSVVTEPALLRALAFGMDDFDRLWWTCLAGRLEEILSGRTGRSQALVLSERWLRERDDAVRYEAFQCGREEAGLGPAALVGMAAFVTGKSLAPAGEKEEPPPPRLAYDTALGVLSMVAASARLGPQGFSLVNGVGLDIASGGDGREAARQALLAAQAPAQAPAQVPEPARAAS